MEGAEGGTDAMVLGEDEEMKEITATASFSWSSTGAFLCSTRSPTTKLTSRQDCIEPPLLPITISLNDDGRSGGAHNPNHPSIYRRLARARGAARCSTPSHSFPFMTAITQGLFIFTPSIILVIKPERLASRHSTQPRSKPSPRTSPSSSSSSSSSSTSI